MCVAVRERAGVMCALVAAVPMLINDTKGLNAAGMLKSVCVRVYVCVSDRKGDQKGTYLKEHLLFMQEKQSAAGTLHPLLQHQREMLNAFD